MKKKDGYVIDTTYPIFFYKEMQPLWLNTVIGFLGFQPPEINTTFSYLELACATGVNLLICAINHPHGYFVGVDFNQQHIEKAKRSADLLGLKNIEFIHADFSEFLASNHRKFDFIVNHGTFSWISACQQQHILEILAQSLNDLGIFYLHYMCYPGSGDLLPLQKLLNLVDEHQSITSLESIEVGKQLFHDLSNAGAFVNHSKIDSILNTLKNSNAYLAHEFLTDHWKPLYSVDVHKMIFDKTGMSYIGSAHPCENIDSISIPEKMQPIIRKTQAPALKEYLKDLARDSKQRVDMFQKKPRQLESAKHLQMINQFTFKLLPKALDKDIEVFNTPIGKIKAPSKVIGSLLQKLRQNHMSFNELLNLPMFHQNPLFLIETLFLMMHEQYLHPVWQSGQLVDTNQIKSFNAMIKSEGLHLNVVPDCATAIYTN